MSIRRLLKGGAWVPSVTVFDSGGGVDVQATIAQARALAEAGAEGVVLLGTTGRGHLLKHEAKLEVIRAAKSLRKDFPNLVLVAGTGTKDIRAAREIVNEARNSRFDGILALPHAQKANKAFFYTNLARACAANGKRALGLVLYHHPRLNRVYQVSPYLLANLMREFSHVVGVKDSSGKVESLMQWRRVLGAKERRRFLLAVGEDKHVNYSLAKKIAKTAIAGTANTAKGLLALLAVFKHWRQGNARMASRAQGRLDSEVDRLLAHEGGFIAGALANRLSLSSNRRKSASTRRPSRGRRKRK